MRRIASFLVVFVAGVVISSCGARQPASGSPEPGNRLLSPAELAQMLAVKDFILVNTHIPYEGELDQTDAFIPYDQIEEHLAQLPADRDAEIVLYCRSGRMSAIAAEVLIGLGYTNVWDLEGGMIAWEEAGFPLSRR